MKFWQKKKTFEISETDQIYKVIYLGNVVTSWAKGEHTLEKPLTALWRNYCNNYANYHVKNGDVKKQRQGSSKQILMKLTICNQGLKALTREFGLTEYWANRITFCGQNSNFPRVFAWIYRHEAKQKKQELRVHACFVNSQSSVNKMISTLQQKVNFALNEFKREKRLRENARRILSMNESINLDDDDDDEMVSHDKTDSEFFSDLVNHLYSKINSKSDVTEKLKDEISLNSSEQMTIYESADTSKNSTLDLKRIKRNPSRGSLNSIKSKSSTSSKKSSNYDCNLIPVRRQFLVKGLKNFKEPIERSRSAPKLSSISEEFLSSDDEENYFGKLLTNNNFMNYYNICEEEPDDEEIIRELGLISALSNHEEELNDENRIPNEKDKTLINFDECEEDDQISNLDQEFKELSNAFLQQKLQNLIGLNCVEDQSNPNITTTTTNTASNTASNTATTSNSDIATTISSDEEMNNHDVDNTTLHNSLCKETSKIDAQSNDSNESKKQIDEKSFTITQSELNDTNKNDTHLRTISSNIINTNTSIEKSLNETSSDESSCDSSRDKLLNQESNLTPNFKNRQPKNDYLTSYSNTTTCQSPQFIIFKRTNSFNNRECDFHAKQIQENCRLIEDLVLNF